MKHVEDIRTLIKTLYQSSKFHALVIKSRPGWAKSTTVESVLNEMQAPYVNLGSYSTSLELYNTMCAYPSHTLLVDDAVGIFNQPVALSLLKAATWSNGGTDRTIMWRSSSDKVTSPSANFYGKLIILTNTIPQNSEIEAFLSRTLCLEIEVDSDEAAEILLASANKKEFYDNTELAVQVASHLIGEYSGRETSHLNLRTLQIAYELARINPETWHNLLGKLFPSLTPYELVTKLNSSSIPVEKQANKFTGATGLSRRTFFSYRKELGIQTNQGC